MSLVIWRDGAPFDKFMSYYMRTQFPKGLDPSHMSFLLGDASLVFGLEMTNATLGVTDVAIGNGGSEEDVATA